MKEKSIESYGVRTKNDSFLITECEDQTEIFMNGCKVYGKNSDKQKRFFAEDHIVNTPKNQFIIQEKNKNISIYKNGILIKKLKTSKPEICSGDCDNDQSCESACIDKAHAFAIMIDRRKNDR